MIGFKHLDLGFDYCISKPDYPFMTDEYEKWAYLQLETAEKCGAVFTHSHAPFDVSSGHELIDRSFKCAEILGIKYMVVHPKWKTLDGSAYLQGEDFIKVNKELYLPIIEKGAKYGVKVLSENLLWGDTIKSTAISALASDINSEYFGWCYDTGHANAFGITPDALIGLSRAPLSLHVQDNHGIRKDEHLLPGDGTVDWKLLLENLHKVGYKGEIVLEAHHQSLDAPDDQRDAILADLLNRAQKLRDGYLAMQ
jgi:sugar phosphate isomerase/epimerase